MKREELQTDILIIGGGTAGCYAAIKAAAGCSKQKGVKNKQTSGEAAVWQPESMHSMPILQRERRRSIMLTMPEKMRQELSAEICYCPCRSI